MSGSNVAANNLAATRHRALGRDESEQAVLAVLSRASDAEDALLLLDVLGLVETARTMPTPEEAR